MSYLFQTEKMWSAVLSGMHVVVTTMTVWFHWCILTSAFSISSKLSKMNSIPLHILLGGHWKQSVFTIEVSQGCFFSRLMRRKFLFLFVLPFFHSSYLSICIHIFTFFFFLNKMKLRKSVQISVAMTPGFLSFFLNEQFPQGNCMECNICKVSWG